MPKPFWIIFLFFLPFQMKGSGDYQFPWINRSTEHGLVHPRVNSMIMDSKGFLWIGTYMGLSRFDGQHFRTFRHEPGNQKSLSDDYIRSMLIDSRDRLWVGTEDGFVNLFHPEEVAFTRFEIPADIGTRRIVKSISEDKSGNIWIACVEGIVKLNPETHEMATYRNPEFPGTTGSLEILYTDRLGRFWAGYWNGGLFLFDPSNGAYTRFFNDPGSPELLRISPMAIREDSRNNLWIGTYNLGLLKISHPSQSISVFSYKKDDRGSINSNQIKSIEVVNDDQIWIGTEEAGLDLFEPSKNRFTHFFSSRQTQRSVEGESIYAMVKDAGDRLWLGSRENGIYYLNIKQNPFIHIREIQGTAQNESPIITALCEDEQQRVWAGIIGDLALVDFENKQLIAQHLNLPEAPNVAAGDHQGNIWIGGLKGSIFCFNPSTGSFKKFIFPEIDGVKIISFHFSGNQVFIGMAGKYGVMDYSGNRFRLINYPFSGGLFHIIREDSVYYFFDRRSVYVDKNELKEEPLFQPIRTVEYDFPNSKCATSSDHFLYCGTDAGLFSIDKENLSVKFLEKLPGPISYSVKTVHAEKNGTVWFATAGNIVRYVPQTGYIRIYDQFDGIPQIMFRDATGCMTRDNRIIMGGENGLVSFYPDQISQVKKTTGIEISSVMIGRYSHAENPIPALQFVKHQKLLRLRYNQNSFTVSFTMPEFMQPDKTLFSWKLEGFDKDWFSAYDQRSVYYMNLPSGEYSFMLRGKDSENNWSEIHTLKIRILPPIWLTWYAYLVYITLAIYLLYTYRNFNIKKERLKNELDLQRLKMENVQSLVTKENEINESKFSFFTNVSHEFKTPLTLIISPLEQYFHSGQKLTDETIRQIFNNAQRLYQLINQILDFRKMEAGKLAMNYAYDDLAGFTVNICNHFKQLAIRKNLAFEIMVYDNPVFTRFDADKMAKIMYNLLSNAVKFTSEGKIMVEIAMKTILIEGNQKNYLEIVVKDTGSGISPESLPYIFDRFYQAKHNNERSQGTGIGLSLAYEFAKMHGGSIEVTSATGKGSAFTLQVPIEEGARINQAIETQMADEPCNGYDESGPKYRYSVLIAEDNAEMRSYLSRELMPDYEIIEAENGAKAMEMCLKHNPDLILSDILMPGTDGLEFCRQLKNDDRTSHIPLLMVTALSAAEYQEQAYRLGADDYITKPFSISILKEKIHNFIASRDLLKRQFIQNAFSEPSILKIASNDEKFLIRTHQVIEENLSDSDFDIDRFAREMATSRSQLYRKLKALTGLSASEYMKITRLKIAARMISDKNFNISEAAYLVGFKDPKYFSKCFQKQFGVIPSRYKSSNPAHQVES